jgi:ankyrin repeat protein
MSGEKQRWSERLGVGGRMQYDFCSGTQVTSRAVRRINTAQLYNKARDGEEAAVRSIIEDGAIVDSKDINRRGRLSLTAEKGYLGIVQLLVQNKVDASSKDKYGQTALHLPIREGHSEVVRFLIGKKADMRADPRHS